MSIFNCKKVKACDENTVVEQWSDIRYRIVDNDGEYYILQCVTLRTTFKLKMEELANNAGIVSNLSSEQACYVGIKHAQNFDMRRSANYVKLLSRKGRYKICYEAKNKDICFIDLREKLEYIMDPRSIAFNPNILREFDPTQCFYIGYLAGKRSCENRPINKIKTAPFLRLVEK
jgi:hypothetical protein